MDLGNVLLILAAALAASALVTVLRSPLEHIVTAVVDLVLIPVAGLYRVTGEAVGALARRRAQWRRDLAHGGPEDDSSGEAPTYRKSDALMPSFYGLSFLALAFADVVAVSLLLASVFGIRVGSNALLESPVTVWFTGVVLVLSLAVAGLALGEVLRGSPAAVRPFGVLTGAGRALVLVLAGVGTLAGVLAVVVGGVLRADLLSGADGGTTQTLFLVLLFLALACATLIAAKGSVLAPVALLLTVAMLLHVPLALLHRALLLAVWGLEALHALVCWMLRLLARPFSLLWDWITEFGWAQRARLRPVGDFGDLPQVGRRLELTPWWVRDEHEELEPDDGMAAPPRPEPALAG